MQKKTVLITGAAKRIGSEIAINLAKQSWNIAVHYNNSEKEAEQLVEEIRKSGVESVAVQADLSDTEQVINIFPQVNKTIGEVHCLINNASLFKNDNISNFTEESLIRHMQVNLYAPLLLSQAFAGQLKGKGSIINILDSCVLDMPAKFFSYAVSRAALWDASKSLAKQLAPDIRVNSIAPGHVIANEKESKQGFEKAYKATPLQISSTTKEICDAVKFFLSSDSVTGQLLSIDGGKNLVRSDFY